MESGLSIVVYVTFAAFLVWLSGGGIEAEKSNTFLQVNCSTYIFNMLYMATVDHSKYAVQMACTLYESTEYVCSLCV